MLKKIVLAAAVFAAPMAMAATTYTIDKVTITGAKTVPPATLLAKLQAHAGAHMTQADIGADQSTLVQELQDAHVGGSVKTRISSRGGHASIEFVIDDQGLQTVQVDHVAPKLDHQVFTGNVKVTSPTLEAATGLKPGDDLSNDKLKTAQQNIFDVYKNAKVNVTIGFDPKKTTAGRIEIDWTLAETKAPATAKKKKNTDDDGYKTE